VEVLGVATCLEGQADHRVLVDADEAGGLADAHALAEVGQDGQGLVLGQSAVEEGGALPLAEAVLAGAAGEATPLLVSAVTEGHAEVAQAALAVVGACGILAAKGLEFVHDAVCPKVDQAVAITLPSG
jgi:hypothetical protein